MPVFHAPIRDMAFVLEEIAGLDEIAQLPGCEEATPDLVTAVLAEAARFAGEVLAPLNPVGDRQGCRLEADRVTTPDGFAAAYRQFVDGGWNALPFSPDWGGQGLPWVVGSAVQEIWHAANMSFALVPMLTQGAVEALMAHGSEELRQRYLPKLVSGEWTGTMNLTEPQAGSDVGALRTKAVRHPDGTYRITGQKIFITAGEHDLADNIVHLVLARLPDAPPGVKGISLFLVPKFLPDGSRNDLACIKLEEKLGIHGSPTCVMAFGDQGGATGWLVGEENTGLALMFTMMNAARLSVGLEGVAQAERATQKAAAYARERVQGHVPGIDHATIIHHGDVRRMVMTGKALTEASRALAYWVAGRVDVSHRHPSSEERNRAHAMVELLTPVVKAWCTDNGIRVADLAIQVHGGMGYVEETGVAQHLRDARIAAIYEGTNGIQAMDLINRKLIRDNGHALGQLVAEMRALDLPGEMFATLRARLAAAIADVEAAARHILDNHQSEPALAGAVAAPFLEMVGIAAGGWLMSKGARAARLRLERGDEDTALPRARLSTAWFYAETVMPRTMSLLSQVKAGSAPLMSLDEGLF